MSDATVWNPGVSSPVDPTQAQFYANQAAASSTAATASSASATSSASAASVSAIAAAGSGTQAAQSASLAQSFSQLGFNSSYTAYDFGTIISSAAYFQLDLGSVP